MIDINEVRDITFSIAAKNKSAFPSPAEWNNYANYANIDLFNYYNEKRVAQLNKEVRGHSLTMPLELTVFVVNEAPISFTSGVGLLPDDQSDNMQLSVLNNNSKVTVKNIDFTLRENYLNSDIDKPTLDYPIYCLTGDTLLIYPTTITQGFLTYLMIPPLVKWAYTISGQRPVYDQGNSVNFLWYPDEKVKLLARILSYMGISIKDDELIQYAERAKQTAS